MKRFMGKNKSMRERYKITTSAVIAINTSLKTW